MHRSALALAGAGHFPGKFCPQVLGRDSLCKLIMQTAVNRYQIILFVHCRHHCRGNDFLTAYGIIDNLQLTRSDHLSELDVRLHDQVGARENIDEDVFVRHVCRGQGITPSYCGPLLGTLLLKTS